MFNADQMDEKTVKMNTTGYLVRTLPEQYLRNLKKQDQPVNFKVKILKSVLIVLVVIGLMGLAAWLFLKSVNNKSLNSNTNGANVNNQANLNQNTVGNSNVNGLIIDQNLNTNQNVNQGVNDNQNINQEINANVNVNSNVNLNSNRNANNGPVISPITSSKDTDQDGLTDAEELVFGSDYLKTDTDGDGYNDKEELTKLYDPVAGQGIRLKDGGLVRAYTNNKYGYTLLLPKNWREETSDPLSVLFVAENGEFVQVIIQDNLTGLLTAKDWYINENPVVLPLSLQDVPIGGMAGVKSVDGFNVYVMYGNYIYTVSYNIGLKQSADFFTTYQMMLNSFQFFVNPLN